MSPKWRRLYQAAKLVADSYELHDPDFGDLKDSDLNGVGSTLIANGDSKSRLEAFGEQSGTAFSHLTEKNQIFVDRLFAKLNLDAPFQPEFLFLSPDPVVTHLYMRKRRFLDGSTILGILAIAGIGVQFPAVFFDEDEDLDKVRRKLESERRAYISALSKFVAECNALITDGKFKDLHHYASIHTNVEINCQLSELEGAVKKLDRKLLKRVSVGLLTDGVPALGGYFLNPATGIATVAHSILEILCKTFGERETVANLKKEFPLAAYVYELKKARNERTTPTKSDIQLTRQKHSF